MRHLEVLIEVAVPKHHELQRRRRDGGSKRIWFALITVLVIAYTRTLQPESPEVADGQTIDFEANQESQVAMIVSEPESEVNALSPETAASTTAVPATGVPVESRAPVQSRPAAQKGAVRPTQPAQPRVSPPPPQLVVNSVVPPLNAPQVNPPRVNSPQAAKPRNVPQTAARFVTSQFLAGKLIRKVVPAYPAPARRNRISGTVILRVIISEQGKIRELQVESGPALLIDAAKDAVRQWEYQPWILDGKPIEMESMINVIFKLRP